MIVFTDGSVYHLNISWALPVTWPGAVYSLEIGINGTEGVLTIDDTHRDMVLAVSAPQNEGYAPDERRLVDFMGSYPPGDIALGELRGPMREETDSWLNRVALGLPTQAATAAEAHNRLMLTNALYHTGPFDGTVMGASFNGMPTTPLLQPTTGIRFDPVKLNWLGSTNRETQVMYVWHTAPAQALEDAHGREIVMGAQAPGST